MSDQLFDVSGYNITLLKASESDLTMVFNKTDRSESEFKVLFENVIHHTDLSRIINPVMLRIDDGGTSYGHDFALRLGKPEIIDYKVLYLFEDIKTTGVMFKALAEKITVFGHG